jgi:hypothetical protein
MITDLTVDTADINDSAVTAAKIASAVAGSGLSGGAGTALAVNVDDSTIEINSDTLRVKDAGIVAAKIADGIITGGTAGAGVKIAADTITNANINPSAAIVDTKLATISTAGKVSNSATTAASANTASAIVARDASGNFVAGTITAALSGNATTATKLATARNFSITGDITAAAVSFNGETAVVLDANIDANTITTVELANDAVETANIKDDAVTGAKISNTAAVSVASVTTSGSISSFGDVVLAGDLQTTKNTNDTFFNVTNGGSVVIMGIDSNQGVNGHDVGSSSIRAVYSRSTNVIGFSSSSQRFKEQISAHIFDEEAVRGMVPVRFKYRADVEEYGDEEAGWNYGFVAEQAEQGGLSELIGRDENGLVDYFAYERMCVAQQQLIRTLFEKVESLEARVASLESK